MRRGALSRARDRGANPARPDPRDLPLRRLAGVLRRPQAITAEAPEAAELSRPHAGASAGDRRTRCTGRQIYLRPVLPNILSVLIVQFTLNFPQVILLETSLSLLGLGIRPPLTSLGQMLGAGRAYLTRAWWIALLPGMAIFLTTMSISIVGDWIRDRLDPALQSRRPAPFRTGQSGRGRVERPSAARVDRDSRLP